MNILRNITVLIAVCVMSFGQAAEEKTLYDYQFVVIEEDTFRIYPTHFVDVLSLGEKVPDGKWVQYYLDKPEQKALLFGIENGKLEGEILGYHMNDIKMLYGWYTKGNKDQEWTWWNEAGQIEAHETWKEGDKNGLWVFYDQLSHKTMEGHYKKDKKHGEWYYYHRDGYIYYAEEYKNGTLTGKNTTYTRDGKVSGYNYLDK